MPKVPIFILKLKGKAKTYFLYSKRQIIRVYEADDNSDIICV